MTFMDYNKIFKNAFNAQINGDYKKSELLYNKLLKNDPHKNIKANIYYNLGLLMMNMGNYKKAVSYFDDSNRLIQNKQNDWNKSLSLLNLGKWYEGMSLYNNRYANDNSVNITSVRFPKLPIEFIEDANKALDKNLLVLNEQGFGDQLLFSIVLEKLSKIVKSATIQVSEDTFDLFSNIYNFDNIKFVIFESISLEDVNKHDMYIGLGTVFSSLYELNTSSFNENFYKTPNSKKIGVCWAANKKSPSASKRSIDPKILKQIDYELVSLQYGCGEEIGVENYTPKNLYESWKRMDGLDAVITVDSVMAHISGLKGIPTLLVINNNFMDWRWKYRDVNETNYSMFYPMVEIVDSKENLNDILNELLEN